MFHTPHLALVSPVVTIAVGALLLGALSGCAPTDGSVAAPPASSPTTAEPSAPQVPVPGSTHEASALTFPDGIPAGFSLTVVAPETTGDAAADTAAAVAELRSFAEDHGAASIRVLPAEDDVPSGVIGGDDLLIAALADRPDVIVVLGESILTDLDGATASNLDQQFVILGAQLPEPTSNVTAVVWPGADVRLADGISPVIALRASAALEAGLQAVFADTTGIVISLG